jgi:hypothetical protein
MKMEGRWTIIVFATIAVVGISGIFEALPHASESFADLALDAGILIVFVGISVLIARWLKSRRANTK